MYRRSVLAYSNRDLNPCHRRIDLSSLGLFQSHLSCWFWLLSLMFWKWDEPMNGTLPLYECRLRGGHTRGWWGHSNPTCCNLIIFSILQSQAGGCQHHKCQNITSFDWRDWKLFINCVIPKILQILKRTSFTFAI